MIIDKKTDVAYILLNAEDSNKLKDGSHDYRAEKFDIDYFIRSVLQICFFTDQILADPSTRTTTVIRQGTGREEVRTWC